MITESVFFLHGCIKTNPQGLRIHFLKKYFGWISLTQILEEAWLYFFGMVINSELHIARSRTSVDNGYITLER